MFSSGTAVPTPPGMPPGLQKPEEVLLPCGQRQVQEEPPLRRPMGVHVQFGDPCPRPRDSPLAVLLRIGSRRFCSVLYRLTTHMIAYNALYGTALTLP